MSKYSRLDVALRMRETGVVPLYYTNDLNIARSVVSACYKGGLRIFEFTNRGDFAHEIFGELVKWAENEMPGLILGVGSVVDAGTCSLYIQSGASFIVSPLLNEEMARVCNRRKVLWMPGCSTLSEISRADELGAEVVKIYPAPLLGGPGFIKTIKGPCPWVQVMPSGGVEPTEENLKAWFDAGAFCVGMGSRLITQKIIEEGAFDALEKKVGEVVSMVQKVRK